MSKPYVPLLLLTYTLYLPPPYPAIAGASCAAPGAHQAAACCRLPRRAREPACNCSSSILQILAWQQGSGFTTSHDFSEADTLRLGARRASQPARHCSSSNPQPGTCQKNNNVGAENCLFPRARCASQPAASPQAPAQKALSLAELPVPAALAGLYGLALNTTQPPEGGTAFAYRGRTWWCALRLQVPRYRARCTRGLYLPLCEALQRLEAALAAIHVARNAA